MAANDKWEILNLKAGDLVEVRSPEEILSTLDENGELGNLPFMPEMLQYCGRQFRVSKRAHKSCNTVSGFSLLRLENTVHLEDVRCDGQAHGGCQATCLIFWKEAWLRRASSPSQGSSGAQPSATHSSHQLLRSTSPFTLEDLFRKARKKSDPANPAEDVYSCQATELLRFTQYLSPWNITHYIEDVFSGNWSFSRLLRGLLIQLFNWFQGIRHGGEYPMYFRSSVRTLAGVKNTPREVLDLIPGELVQVRNRDDILRTLDWRERNRGLSFDREMVKYCGGRYKVLKRVEQIINEKTGKMMTLPNDCIMLEGVICVGDLHGFCPRSIYSYWREIWLERVK